MTTDKRVDRRTTIAQRGAALVEFALVALLLFGLIFGIISYSYMMSFRQSLTQAGAEGARAAAVAPASFSETQRVARALAAVEEAIGGYGGGMSCNNGVLDCSVDIDDCTFGVSSPQCVTVTVDYPYRSNPLLPSFPGLGLVMPEHLIGESVAEVSGS